MPLRPQDRDKIDLLGADEVLHEELEEAAATPDALEPTSHAVPDQGYEELYLDTIDRKVLDFDFEKLCSVTLSHMNVYACLVCGKYFQGRGPKSQAYFHAINVDHHVYINMETKKIYVLPEGYEVTNPLLNDIKYVVDPRYTKEEVSKLDTDLKSRWDLLGKEYTPGFVGINNIKANDYFNAVIHALAHVRPLRNYFLLEDMVSRNQLSQRFSVLVRKIWNPRAFKSHVSPHELLQEVALNSDKKFTLTEQADPAELLSWLLHRLHLALGGKANVPGSSIIHKVFQGNLQHESQLITARANAGDRLIFEDAAIEIKASKFLLLTLDLPSAPLFRDELDENTIPQVSLLDLLQKYDGVHAQEKMKNRVRYRLMHPLPPYVIFLIKRFEKRKFLDERNPTIVTWDPTRPIDLNPYCMPDPNLHDPSEEVRYELVANVIHEGVKVRDDSVSGEREKSVWKVQLKDKSRDEWVEVQDLFVRKVPKETLFAAESYIMIWERKSKPRGRNDGGA
jgi:U4/U6.U5 tri-snRNP-associated protein 2